MAFDRPFKIDAPHRCTGSIYVGGEPVHNPRHKTSEENQEAWCDRPAMYRITWQGEPKKKGQHPNKAIQWYCWECLMGLLFDYTNAETTGIIKTDYVI